MNSPYLGRGFRQASFALSVIGLCAIVGSAQAQENQSADGYEAGRGLITLEGPSGMFINPTSATLPENAATLQYCVFFPNNKNDVVGHGVMGAYGFTDRIELGVSGNYIDIDNGSGLEGFGPFARVRLTKDEGKMPQTSVGAYSRFGDDALDKIGIFGAAYRRIEIDPQGPIRSVGLHVGVRQLWLDDNLPEDSTTAAYTGVEVQFPLRVYAVGEVTTQDNDIDAHVPFAYGLQWRAAGIAMSLAGIQNGGTSDVSFYYGIGYGKQF